MAHSQRIGLHLTDRCQLDCDHCLRDPALTPTDMDVELVRRLAREASGRFGIRQFSLTGGEPTLHPRFAEVIDILAAAGCEWDMVTNGHRFERVTAWLQRPERRRALRSITFSLDGDEPTHDAIRGAGSYRSVLLAITAAGAHGFPFGVQMAVHARNAGQIEAVGLLAAQLGAKHVSFPMTQPTGTHLDPSLHLTAREWRRVRDRVESLARALSIAVVLPEGYPSEQPMSLCGPLRGDTLHVDVRGRLTLCCQHADVPSDGEREVAGAISELGLPGAYRRLLDLIHATVRARLEALDGHDDDDDWRAFECNACLRSFGKVHWSDSGASGPSATRARWRGAWAKPDHERRKLKVIG